MFCFREVHHSSFTIVSDYSRIPLPLNGDLSRNYIEQGTLYPALHKLEKKGYITSYLKEQGKGPARTYYRLTVDGHKVLRQKTKEWNGFVKMINEDNLNG